MKTLNRVRCESSDKYGVYIINAYMQGALMLNTGNTLLLGNMHVEDNNNPVIGQSDVMIFSANDIYMQKFYQLCKYKVYQIFSFYAYRWTTA